MDALLFHLQLLIEPIGFLWLCLLALTAVALRKKQRALAAGTGALALFLYAVCSTGLPGSLLRQLERPYAGVDVRHLPPADAVMLLGGGMEPSLLEITGFHLNYAGDRIITALELIRLGKAPVLVLGGGTGKIDGETRVESQILKAWIDEAGLAHGTEVIALEPCANTHDEAQHLRAIAAARGWKDVLLVTSANHLRRATATFTTAGVPVRPVPCNFLTNLSTAQGTHEAFVPSWGGLEKISIYLHEVGGWYEYRRRGWIKTPPTVPDR